MEQEPLHHCDCEVECEPEPAPFLCQVCGWASRYRTEKGPYCLKHYLAALPYIYGDAPNPYERKP